MSGAIHSDYWPIVVLVSSIVLVVLLITRLRLHAFIALMLSAIFVGLVSPSLPQVAGQHPLVTVVELPMVEFGVMAGRIAWVIALAAVIGTAMMESGAAERIVTWLLEQLGEKRTAIALLISGYILAIPVFFDTVFFLLIPIGITLALKTGRDFVLYVTAIAGGAAITHSIVPPTPGPLVMAETLNISMGTVIFGGLITGILPALAGYQFSKWINTKMVVPVRMADAQAALIPNPPPIALSVLPVLVPLIFISAASVAALVTDDVPGWIVFIGNKNIAISAGALIAILLWKNTRKLGLRSLGEAIARPLEVGGTIILITSAGGAFGSMINHSGIGLSIRSATEAFDMHYIVLAWIIAAVMKIAQGSGTVSMITTSAIMAALIGPEYQLPFHRIYILLAIGFGSVFISWMNDSGFWVVVRMSGFTEREGLKTWTLLLAVISVVGLVQILLLSWLFPMT